jgi:DNA mismatch endonuclease (patch repair protein)
MTDIWSKRKRSEVMSLIRSHGNKATELRLLEVFRAHRITGWRRHQPLPGKPDFVFPSIRLVLFVDGCFWHACPLHATKPRSNVAYWRKKLMANQARDRRVTRLLRSKGWRVLRIWEHELARKTEARLQRRILRALASATI